MATEQSAAHHVAIVIGKRSVTSTVAIDGVDISGSLSGIEVSAHVDGITRVVLYLSASVEVTGEAGEVLKTIGDVK